MTSRSWGIDLSNYQGGADLGRVKAAGASFVFAKASEGADYADPTFAAFRAQAAKCGLPLSAYHYARPQPGRAPEVEAKQLCAQLGGKLNPGELPPVLDLEVAGLDDPHLVAWAMAWLTDVQACLGVTPILYTGASFAATHLAGAGVLGAFPLWLAAYQATEPFPPGPWQRWTFWQQTDSATVQGVPGPVDRTLSILTPSQIAGLTRQPARPLPAPKPAPVSHELAYSPGVRELHEGMRGPDVAYVQRFLGITEDGDFGRDTLANVERYQRMRGLSVDGVVGPTTWRNILGH
jgi:lysozyme